MFVKCAATLYVLCLLLPLVLRVIIIELPDSSQFFATSISVVFDSALWLELLDTVLQIKLLPLGELLEQSVPTACLSPGRAPLL